MLSTPGFATPPQMPSPGQVPYAPPRFMDQGYATPPIQQLPQFNQVQQGFNNGFSQPNMISMDFNNQQMPHEYLGGVGSRLNALNANQMQPNHMGMHMMDQHDNRQMEQPRPRRQVRKQNSGNLDNSPSRVRKFTCRFDVGIQNEKTFQV